MTHKLLILPLEKIRIQIQPLRRHQVFWPNLAFFFKSESHPTKIPGSDTLLIAIRYNSVWRICLRPRIQIIFDGDPGFSLALQDDPNPALYIAQIFRGNFMEFNTQKWINYKFICTFVIIFCRFRKRSGSRLKNLDPVCTIFRVLNNQINRLSQVIFSFLLLMIHTILLMLHRIKDV